MAVERHNIYKNPQALDKYIDGVWELKREIKPGETLNTYDLFVKWHADAMMEMTPRHNNSSRNAAHSGPVFLPWHRMYLNKLELELQRVLNDQTFGLPYWSWGEDGDLPANQQQNAEIWNKLGGSGNPITSGPFKFDKNNPQSNDNWVIKVEMMSSTQVVTNAHRGLDRFLGAAPSAQSLPNSRDIKSSLSIGIYDSHPWNRRSSNSFRNKLEGWGRGPELHNKVHVYVGGDMTRGHSPNDPVFFLHHCNVDRIWAYWQKEVSSPDNYLPLQSAPQDLERHRIDDVMFPMKTTDQPIKIVDVLGTANIPEYDNFDDLKLNP